MQPRFVGRLGAADAVSVANAVLGFLAVLAASVDPTLSARVVLLAAIADALDGLVARRVGGTRVGPFLDSLADVASFAVAPAVLLLAAVRAEGAFAGGPAAVGVAAVVVATAYVAMAVVRLALYTADDTGHDHTVGAPASLGTIVLAAAVLAGVTAPPLLVGATAVFAYLMVAPVEYPDVPARYAVVMGVGLALAVAFPAALRHAFPLAMLVYALGYLVLGPVVHSSNVEAAPDDNPTAGERV